VDLQHAGNHLFVVEQQGRIWTFENRHDVTEKTQFLDLTDRIRSVNNEEGLLGLAFHPNYDTNGLFFVYYTASNPRRSVISRFNSLSRQVNRGDPNSEVIILEVGQPAGNHNGGQIGFGPDGYLYIALGDGGGANDQFSNGQNTQSLLGTISRIDVNEIPYAIPSDNPFANSAAGRPEIFAWGLRNPWRFSFDIKTGILYSADVGQNEIEEVNIIEKGQNYGWPIMEGTKCLRPENNCDQSGLVSPIFEYDHSNGPASVTGGYVYQGPGVPDLTGWYVFGDYVDGRFWGLLYDGSQVIDTELLLDTFFSPSSFGIDHQGEVFVLLIDGRIHRFSATGGALGFESFIEPLQFTRNSPIPIIVLPAARGGSGSFNYSLSPTIPTGLSFDSATRTLRGTATEVLDQTTFTLNAEDTDGLQGSLDFELAVHEPLHQTVEINPHPGFSLHGHYPNPTSADLDIVFDLPEKAAVMVELYDMLGRQIRTVPSQTMTAGSQRSIRIPTDLLPSGSYIYRIRIEMGTEIMNVSETFFLQ